VRVFVSAVLVVSLLGPAYADPPVNVHLRTPSTVHTDGGVDLRLPPGYFLDETSRRDLDAEVKRLQTQEIRLAAENASLVKATQGWQPGWYTLAISFAGGLALGWYVCDRLK
jgi:hypothetical protein